MLEELFHGCGDSLISQIGGMHIVSYKKALPDPAFRVRPIDGGVQEDSAEL